MKKTKTQSSSGKKEKKKVTVKDISNLKKNKGGIAAYRHVDWENWYSKQETESDT